MYGYARATFQKDYNTRICEYRNMHNMLYILHIVMVVLWHLVTDGNFSMGDGPCQGVGGI